MLSASALHLCIYEPTLYIYIYTHSFIYFSDKFGSSFQSLTMILNMNHMFIVMKFHTHKKHYPNYKYMYFFKNKYFLIFNNFCLDISYFQNINVLHFSYGAQIKMGPYTLN